MTGLIVYGIGFLLMSTRARFLVAVTLLGVVLGCAGARAPASPDDTVWHRYLAAVAAARRPEASKISKDLLPISRDASRLQWRDGRVLMVTWTKSVHFPRPPYERGYAFPLYGDTWFTVVPAIREFCQGFRGGDLDLRLRQRLGLPPDDANDVFVELWIDPQDIFRPCPDPAISDSQCQVGIPLVDAAPVSGETPWPCPPASPQLSGKFVTVDPAHLHWMCKNWRHSHENPDPKDNYPWTALGYTYDWNARGDHRGESEYVALGGTRVVFERRVGTEEYCGRR